MKLYSNNDPAMDSVRRFEKCSSRDGNQSLLKDANKYADELGLTLQLTYPIPPAPEWMATRSPLDRSVRRLRNVVINSLETSWKKRSGKVNC